MRPLLSAAPETGTEGEPVEYLGGDILFDHVSFRYDADGPLILDDVTIRAHTGEFVAIAGDSGAGKSTLFRLALGIDWPTAGAVYYDGRDLRHLNLKTGAPEDRRGAPVGRASSAGPLGQSRQPL